MDWRFRWERICKSRRRLSILRLAHTSLLHPGRGLTLIPLISPAFLCRFTWMLRGGCKRAAGRHGAADPAAVMQDSAIPMVCHCPPAEAISPGRCRAQRAEPASGGDSQPCRVKLRVTICGVSETHGSPWKGPPSYLLTPVFASSLHSWLSISTSYPEPIQVLMQPSPLNQQKINPEKRDDFISLFLLR